MNRDERVPPTLNDALIAPVRRISDRRFCPDFPSLPDGQWHLYFRQRLNGWRFVNSSDHIS